MATHPTASSHGTVARLAARGLSCRRGERLLFAAVDFAVGPGEIVWLRGANGQGKTTLLRTLAGLAAPDAGTVTWGETAARPPFLYIAHANALKEDLSAAESLRFLMRLAGAEPAAALIDDALARLDLASRRQALVRTLSQGQRRRVALARLAAACEPATWLLDEPFDALDAAGIETLNALLVSHAKRGGSIVLTSHLALTIEDPVPFAVFLQAPMGA